MSTSTDERTELDQAHFLLIVQAEQDAFAPLCEISASWSENAPEELRGDCNNCATHVVTFRTMCEHGSPAPSGKQLIFLSCQPCLETLYRLCRGYGMLCMYCLCRIRRLSHVLESAVPL